MAKNLISVDDVLNYQTPTVAKTNKKKKKEEDSFLYKAAGYIPIVQGVRQGVNLYNGIKDTVNNADGTWFKSSEGNFGQTLLSSGLDIAENITAGGLSSVEGIADDWRHTGANILDLFGADDKADKLRQEARENTTGEIMNLRKRLFQGDLSMSKTEEEVAQDDWLDKYSVLGTKSEGVFQGVGNSAANAIMSRYLGGASAGLGQTTQGILGLVPMYMSARGQGTNEALENGASPLEARLYGTLSGIGESGSEMMFGGLGKLSKSLGFGTGALDDVVIKKLTDKVNGTLVKNGLDLLLRGAGEGTEEVVSGLWSAMAKKLTYMKQEDIDKLIKDENLWDSFVSGALSSILMEAPSHIGSTIQGTEASTGITKNENKVVEAVVEERTKGQNLTKKEINQVRQQVREDLQNGYITPEQIEQVLGKEYTQSKDFVNQKDTFLQESYREQARRRTTFNTDLSQYKNENQRKIVQKAIDSGILNDSKKTHNFVDLVSKIAADKGMDFEFTNNQRIAESGFGVEGKTVNGYVNGNTIGLNIESNNALNKVLGHEVTHVLEGTELYQALQDSLKSYVGEAQWNARIKELTETYKNVENADVTKELTADLVGENLFNNEDFVRSLSTKNRNLFEKIFDEIKYMVKVATAGSKEKRELVKLQKVFQEAYRDSKTNVKGTKYSLNDYEEYQNETKAKLQEIRDTVGDDFANNLENQMNEYKEKHPLEYKIREFTNSRDAKNINDEFFKEHDSDYDKNSGTNTPDGRVTVLHLQKGDNLAKVSFTENQDKIWIDELYIKNQKQGYGSEIVNAIREYANEQGKDVEAFKELSTAKGFWDKALNRNTKYSLTDNQGRELSKEQQEYFKDSKIRNDNGELEVVYHTTPNQFTVFDSERAGENTGYDNTAFGSFVTTNKNFSQRFGDINGEGKKGNTMEMYANITNPITHPYNAEYKYSGEQLDNIVENWFNAIGETEALEELKSYVEDGKYDSLYQAYRNTVEFSDESPFEYASDEKEALQDAGYDGVEFVEGLDKDVNYGVGNSTEPVSSYAVFNSNQLKNIDNTNPTSNPDIRYSLSTAEEMGKYNEDRKNVFKQLDKDFGGGVAIWEANLDGRDYDDSVRYLKQRQSIKDKFAKENNIVVEEVKKPVEYRVAGNRSEEVQKFIRDNNATMENLINNADLQKQYFNELEKAMLNDDWTQEETDNYLSKFNDYFDSQRQRPSEDLIWPLLRFQNDIENIIEGKTEEVDNIETSKRERELIDDSPEFDKYVKKYVDQLFNTKPVLDAEEVMEEAKYNHGTTDDYSTGAYMTTDGSLLDFNSHGYRDDHRTIDAFDLSLQEFMDYGAIRMQPEGNGFEISIEPTSAQYNRLEDYIDNYLKENGDKIYVDCGKEGQVYSTSTPTSKIINDIKAFFRDGTFPKQSEYAQFMYSLSDAPKQDNKGRELTLQQQDFYRNVAPQLRDENGNIKTFYHGTPAGDFTVFREGSYFSDREEYATGYQNTWASSISSGKEATNPKTYEVYLNITNPFTLSNQTAKDIYINEYIKGGNSAYYDPYTDYTNTINQLDEIDWVEGEDLKEWLQENHPEFDGLILDEGGDGGYGEAEYRWRGLSYLPFRSNQVKNVDNLNPTDDADIRYQLGTNEIAPTRGWNIRGRDIALEEALAPVKEQINQLQDTLEELIPYDRLQALTEEEANRIQDEIPFDENIKTPVRFNLTPEESKRLDFLDRLERENLLPESLVDERNELTEKENQQYDLELTPVRSLEDVRDIDEVAKDRKANAYQYEHPEVKPYFQEEARVMLNELNESQKAERHIEETKRYEGAGHWLREEVWKGTERETSPSIAAVLDGELGTKYTYDQIRKGLNAIIEDHGAENIAVAKRLEFILDDRLRNGYEAWTLGGTMKDANGQDTMVQPNQDYLNMLREQSWNEYYDQAPWIEKPTIERPQEIAPTRQTADEMLLPTQQATRETEVKNKRQIEPRKKSKLRQAYETSIGGFVNRNVLIDDLSKRSKNTAIKHKGDMWSNYMGEGQSNISNYQTDINGNAIGEGVNKIFDDAEKAGIPKAVFNEFLIDYSNIDRWRNNKGSQTPYEESARRLRDYAIKYPQIKEHAQKVWKYGENSLQNRVDAGLMSKETAQTLRELYPHYVPYISQTEDIDTYYKKLNELKPLTIKRARGGAGALLPVQEALAQYTMSEKKSIRQNALFNEIIDTIGEGNNFGAEEKSDYTGMTDSLFTDENGAYLTAYKDGKQRTATIDMDLYNELSRTSDNQVKDIEERLSLITKPLQKVSEIRRNILTTWSPSFVFKNAIKDIHEAVFNSKYTKDMLKNYLPAFKELRNMNTKEAQQFVSLYGSGLTQGEFLNDTINESTRNVKGLSWLKNVNEIVELAPRYAEFKASLQNGATLEEAMYNAREVTTNFGRGGTIAKALNRNGFTFLNSSIQGFDKLVRNFSGENGAKGVAASLAKAVMFGIVPAVFNELAFGSGDDKDEEYEALPDYIKDNYYLIKFGDGNFIRIPKGRVLSIFGSAARRTIETAEGEEGAFDGFLENAWSQTGVNNPAENNIFAPLIQAHNNQAWYGGDIVPSRLQDKPANEQYDASVDNFSIWLSNTALGKKMGLSPYKVNYVLDQYTGGIGDIALPMITEEAKSNGSLLAPVVDQFTADSTTDNKYVSDFYSKKEEITKLANGSNATDEETLQKKYLDGVSLEMSELYKERREVQADKSLSKKEKYEKSQNIKKEINKLAKEGLDNYQNVSVSGDFAEINGNNYQKGEDGKWKKVKEKTQDDTKALGLTGSESNSYVKTTENIKNIKDTYSNSTVRKNKVLTEIKNSNLPKEAKLQLYKDNYKDQMVDNYMDLGMDINSYLDYKTQDFTADKDKYGKSISGSKKQKVFDYINNMNIPFEQKVMLAKQEYPNYDEYNQEIIDYLNKNNNIDYNEMEKILLDLGFKVDEQGNISW